MDDLLNVVKEGDLLTTFANIFEVVIALDVLTLVCCLLGKAGNYLSD